MLMFNNILKSVAKRIKTNDYNSRCEYGDVLGRLANVTTEYVNAGYIVQFQDVESHETRLHGKHWETRVKSATWARVWDSNGKCIFHCESSKYGARLETIRFLENY